MATKRLYFLAGALMVMLQASAQFQSGEQVFISEPSSDDLYLFGDRITVNAPVYGDVVAGGGTIHLNDSVHQDVLVAGGDVVLGGWVGDDVRCAGGTLKILSDVEGDVIAAGGTLIIEKGVIIGGKLISAGGDVRLEGEVLGHVSNTSGVFMHNGIAHGDLVSRSGKAIINGRVNGYSTLAANTIDVSSAAHYSKNVNYWNEEGSLEITTTVFGAGATYDPTLKVENEGWQTSGFPIIVLVMVYLGSALLMIILAEFFFGVSFKKAADTVKLSSLQSMGFGFLFVLGTPVAIVIIGFTLVGLPLSMLLLFIYLSVLLLATVIVSLLASNWINNTYYQASWGRSKKVLLAFGIFVVLKLATFTPFVGSLVMLMLACLTFGGLLLNVKLRRRSMPAVTS